MNPSPDAVTKLQAHVPTLAGGWAGMAVDQLVTALNTASITNPVAPPRSPKPFTSGDVMGCLGPSSVANVRGIATGLDLINKINAQDVTGIGHWAVALQAGTPMITGAEAAAVLAVITATPDDPAWTARISWARANLGRTVDRDDVTKSRPANRSRPS